MQAEYPFNIKDFGTDVIDGDYLNADHINALRAEVSAIQSALGEGLSNTLSAGGLLAAGDLITASAPGVLARLAAGTDGQILSADSAAAAGLAWTNPQDNTSPRVESLSTSATLLPNAGSYDQFNVTALAQNAAISAPTGGALDGKKLLIRIKDDGTPRTLSWNAAYAPIGISLPTTTTAGKTHYIGAIYNAHSVRWDVLAASVEA